MKRLRVNNQVCQGTFFGGEIEPGTFHGGEIEPGTFHGGEIEPGTFHHDGDEATSDLKDKDKDDKGNGEEDVSSDETPVDTKSKVKDGD